MIAEELLKENKFEIKSIWCVAEVARRYSSVDSRFLQGGFTPHVCGVARNVFPPSSFGEKISRRYC